MAKHSPEIFEGWKPAGYDGDFDWDFILPAFAGTKITPMDIDGVIEKKGNFLVFETKRKGNEISLGQKITLTNLWRKPGFTILQLEGKTSETITGCAIYSAWEDNKTGNVGDLPIKPATTIDVLYAVRRWFCRVNNWPKPSRSEWLIEIGASK